MEKVRDDEEGIQRAADVVRHGGIFIYPTDTCYGLGCDATSEEAIRRIIKIKTREDRKPLSIIVYDISAAERYVILTEEARILFSQFPGITIALPKKEIIPDVVNREKVAIRIPDCFSAREIARISLCPLIATSANKSGDPPQYTPEGALASLGNEVDMVVDAGRLPGKKPSTIVDLVTREATREGEAKFCEVVKYVKKPLRIKKGAEADLYLTTFFNYFGFGGREPILIKHRIKKGYRASELDSEIRKTRTVYEGRLLSQAKKALKTPYLYDVDKKNMNIVMEYIEGERVRDVLSEDIAGQIGPAIGKLHSAGLIHGDITTSNMIMKDGELYFIDFGLGEFSRETEAFAVDLHLFKECLKSVHYEQYENLWKILCDSYSHPDKNAILSKIEEIEKRGRYHER